MMEILNLNYYEQEPEDTTFPDIMVDITHRCNMECNNCYIPTRTPPDMELAKFKKFIKRFPNRRMFRIVGAEPTLHKHCIDFIKTVLEEGHLCLLITNGLRLSSPSFVKKLQATGLKQIYMSMNGVDRDDWYETIDDLACAEKKLKAFKNIANKFNLDIGTIIVKGKIGFNVGLLMKRGTIVLEKQKLSAPYLNYNGKNNYSIEGTKNWEHGLSGDGERFSQQSQSTNGEKSNKSFNAYLKRKAKRKANKELGL